MKLAGVISFPFHIGDWLGGTQHLDTLEKGAYFQLLICHYQAGEIGLKDDDLFLSRITGTSAKVWTRIRPILAEKFDIENGYWKHQKVIEVCRKVSELSAGQRSKALKKHKTGHAAAQPQLCQPQTINQKPLGDSKLSPPHTPKNTNQDFEQFWAGWEPFDMDKGSKAQAKKFYEKARKETNHETLIAKRDQYLANCHRHGRRTAHASTWLNPTGRRGWADDYQPSPDNPTTARASAHDRRTADHKLRDRVNATARQIDDLIGE